MHDLESPNALWDDRITNHMMRTGITCRWGQDLQGKLRGPHRHNGIEIVFCEQGEGTYYVGGRNHSLSPGVILIFPADLPHFMNVNNRYERWVLCFEPTTFNITRDITDVLTSSGGPLNGCGKLPKYYTTNSREQTRFKRIFEEIRAEARNNAKNSGQYIRLLIEQLALLVSRYDTDDYSFSERNSEHFQVRPLSPIHYIMGFIDEHFAKDLSVELLADVFNYTPGHIWRLFRDGLGLSPTQYINERRLLQATTYLRTTHHPISLVAEKVGYRHASYFTQLFRNRTGYTPREYRSVYSPESVGK